MSQKQVNIIQTSGYVEDGPYDNRGASGRGPIKIRIRTFNGKFDIYRTALFWDDSRGLVDGIKKGDFIKLQGEWDRTDRKKDDRTWYEDCISCRVAVTEGGAKAIAFEPGPDASPEPEMTFQPDDELPF